MHRNELAIEGWNIHNRITTQWKNGSTFQLETELVVNTVARAILNSSESRNILHYRFPTIYNTETTAWDVTRYVEQFKNKPVQNSESDMAIDKVELAPIREPTTFLDQHGRVMAWALPGVLHPNRLVRWQL